MQEVAYQPHRQDWWRLVAYDGVGQRREHMHFVTVHAVRHQLMIEAGMEVKLAFECPNKTRRLRLHVLLH